ncbi:DNA repair protein [Micromonospora sp. NPDC093277]|uniref:DNA repair protein n=1 Tax=Micromonospora sp. NPDC093277 TaxID=3364291 RepID=UPI0037FBCF8B
MPKQPADRYQQDAERNWPATGETERRPAQPRYREARTGPLSWAALNALPTEAATRHGLNTR